MSVSASRRTFILHTILWTLAATALLAFENRLPAGITYMSSASLPEGWYVTHPVSFPLSRGETVCAVYHEPRWAYGRGYLANGSFICKHVTGLPGDYLENREGAVWICQSERAGCAFAGRILSHDSKGRPVVAAPLPQRIPPGYVFLGSTRVPNSFDSRYLGLFPVGQIKLAIRKI